MPCHRSRTRVPCRRQTELAANARELRNLLTIAALPFTKQEAAPGEATHCPPSSKLGEPSRPSASAEHHTARYPSPRSFAGARARERSTAMEEMAVAAEGAHSAGVETLGCDKWSAGGLG